MKTKIAFFVFLGVIFPLVAHQGWADSVLAPVFNSRDVFTGDLPEMKKRRFIRVLVTHSKTNFFLMKGVPHGFEYEMLKQYEKYLNKGKSKRAIHTQLVFIPTPFDQLIPALLKGRGDISAAGLTITPDRRKQVAFTTPYLPRVNEIVVSHKRATGLKNLADLSGRTVAVVRASSYLDSLKMLNSQLRAQKRKPVNTLQVSKNLEAEDVLELVNAGVLKVTVVDQHIAQLWSGVLTNLTLHKELKVHQGGQIAWAVRPTNPKLEKSLNRFLHSNKKGTLMGNILFKRYYQNREWIKNPLEKQERKKLDRFIQLFKKYGNQYGFDWLAIAAQAYQESAFNQKAKSSRGAIGVMQMLPSTAASRDVNIFGIEKLENNIHAGVKYLALIRDRYFANPKISLANRVDFSFAAYNAGPSKIQSMRRKAKTMGLHPDKWFYNVELAALRYIGQEPVRYVANIHKYYVAYSLISESLNKRAQELKAKRK